MGTVRVKEHCNKWPVLLITATVTALVRSDVCVLTFVPAGIVEILRWRIAISEDVRNRANKRSFSRQLSLHFGPRNTPKVIFGPTHATVN